MPHNFFLAAAVAGFVGAISGLGPGVVLIPVLTVWEVPIREAIAISNLSFVALSSAAAAAYVRRHIPNLNVSAYTNFFALLGALLGSILTLVSAQQALVIGSGGFISASAIMMWRYEGVGRAASGVDRLAQVLGFEGSYYDEAEQRTIAYQGRRAATAGSLLFLVGLVSGLLGVGGGALSLLVFVGIMGLPPKVALSTSQLTIGIMALVGSGVFLGAGLYNPALIAPVLLGVLVGTLGGSALVIQLRNQWVRVIMLAVVVVFGLEVVARGMGWIR